MNDIEVAKTELFMAKDAEDREDLLRDATAYVARIEFNIPDVDHEIFCGFRENDAFSLYWGQDTVFQFNANAELRRAFWQDRMIASFKHKLNWLERDENAARMRMRRVPMPEIESNELLDAYASCRRTIVDTVSQARHSIVGEFPENGNVSDRVIQWLQEQENVKLALHPGAG